MKLGGDWMNRRRLLLVAITATIVSLGVPAAGQNLEEQVKNLGSTDIRVQNSAVQAVEKASLAAAPALVAGLRDKNPRTRLQCFKFLRAFHSPTDLEAINDATIREDDFLAQEYGVMAIASFKNDAAIDRLTKVMGTSGNLNIRIVALREIAAINGRRAIPMLASVLSDSRQPLIVRSNAARELARLGDSSGHSVAIEALHDALAPTREAGIQALGLIAKQSDISLLESKAVDQAESERTRLIAKKAIRHISLESLPEPQRFEFLKNSLADSHAWIREWAASELAEQKVKGARTLLEDAASQADHPGQREAAKALQTLRE